MFDPVTATAAVVGTQVVGGILGNESARQNANAITTAGYIQKDSAINAAQIQADAAREAAAAAEKARITQRDSDIVEAQQWKARSEQYLMEAIPIMEAYIQQGGDTSNAEFQAALGSIKQAYQPYIEQGAQADQKLSALTMGTPEEAKNALTLDPGYQFRLQQGQQALERSQVGKRNLLSGAGAMEMQNYGQGMASDEFTNAYNRLMGLSNRGMTAKGVTTGYDWANAGIRSTNALNLNNSKAQNVQNITNTRTQGQTNILQANMGGNANLANAQNQGAWNINNAINQGSMNTANALSNQANMNMQAETMRNNFLPQTFNSLANTGLTMYGMNQGARSFYGGGGSVNPSVMTPVNNSLSIGTGYARL